MREIKFRAWYEKEKEMQNVRDIYFNKETGEIESFITRGKKSTYATDVHTHKLMQYTGLKDKNGVEIYEGDCFKKVFKMIEIPTGRTFEQTEVGVVKFDDGHFTCHIDGWGHVALKDVLGCQNENNDYWKNGLIIGNIYENPELLETKKSS